jgi:phosphatidylinositol glycan class M
MLSCTQCESTHLSLGTRLTIGYRWGHPFLEHTFIYHISRLDHRHNFSPYFYPIYLSLTSASSILRHPLASFAPQLGLSVGLGFVFGDDLGMAWFVQTFAFVTFNKVCTSQVCLPVVERR